MENPVPCTPEILIYLTFARKLLDVNNLGQLM